MIDSIKEFFGFKKKEYKVPDYKDTQFYDIDGFAYRYAPQKDITPWESAMLIPIFQSLLFLNRFKYIREHNLIRHFEKVEKSETK